MAKIADFPWGWIGTYDDNEIEIVSTIPDPPKIRLAVDASKVESNLGGVTFNLRRADGRHEEYGYIMGRLTADKRAGSLYVALRHAGEPQSREVLYIDPTVALFRVPVIAPNSGQAPTRFYTDRRRFCVNWQDDTGQPTGIVYDTWKPGTQTPEPDEAKWKAVGKLAMSPL